MRELGTFRDSRAAEKMSVRRNSSVMQHSI